MTLIDQRSEVAPGRQSRRGGRRKGRGSGIAGVAAGLVMLLAAVGLQTQALGEGSLSDPLSYTGSKGEIVDAQRFTVRLDAFSTARKIQLSDTETIETGNIFLIVQASAKSSMKPYHLGQPVLLTPDGVRYAATDRVDSQQTLANVWVQPDIWVKGPFFFEVPAKALPGARVVFGLPPQAGPQEPYRPEVEIDLGLDEAAARKLAGSPQDVYSIVEK
ncbi:hypothetical protein ABZW11_15870 [Nonomuraea sp. NPDC004580]|uniref:hypothetical protein n=1 Tax=Nonomuraea sp. NPDC004580 TaxID=3154552 RepID=UPI0033BD65E1